MCLNIGLKIVVHFAALEDNSNVGEMSDPKEAGKRKIASGTSDAPPAKRPQSIRHEVPSLRVVRTDADHTMPVIPPLSRQQSLYMIEGCKTWTTGVQPVLTASHGVDR